MTKIPYKTGFFIHLFAFCVSLVLGALCFAGSEAGIVTGKPAVLGWGLVAVAASIWLTARMINHCVHFAKIWKWYRETGGYSTTGYSVDREVRLS